MTWWRYVRRATPNCRRVLRKTRSTARACGRAVAGADDVALALLQDGANVGAQLVVGRGLDTAALLAALRGPCGPTKRPSRRTRVGPEVEELLRAARRVAQGLQHAYIGTEHLMLVLLQRGESPLAGALRRQGQDPQAIRDEILELIDSRGGEVHDLKAEFPGSAGCGRRIFRGTSGRSRCSSWCCGTKRSSRTRHLQTTRSCRRR